jgi:hypothetical protein
MGPRSGVPDGVRARHCVILGGIVPPFLVLLWLAALLAVRRIAWSRPAAAGSRRRRGRTSRSPSWSWRSARRSFSPWGVRRPTSTGPSGSGRGTSSATRTRSSLPIRTSPSSPGPTATSPSDCRGTRRGRPRSVPRAARVRVDGVRAPAAARRSLTPLDPLRPASRSPAPPAPLPRLSSRAKGC